MSPIAYETIRHQFILVRNEPERGAIVVLLRALGAEPSETADRLRAAGLTRECEVTWCLPTNELTVDAALLRIHEVLGEDALFDAGTSFDLASARRLQAAFPQAWRGRYLMHVGGTHRCLIVDAGVADYDLAKAFREAEAEYFAADYHPLTE